MLWKLLVMLVRVAVIMAPLPPLLTAQPPPPRSYTPVDQLHNEIDRLFGDFFGGFFSPWRAFSGMTPRSATMLPIC